MPHANIVQSSSLASLSNLVVQELRQVSLGSFTFVIHPGQNLYSFHLVQSHRVVESLRHIGQASVLGSTVSVPNAVFKRLNKLQALSELLEVVLQKEGKRKAAGGKSGSRGKRSKTAAVQEPKYMDTDGEATDDE